MCAKHGRSLVGRYGGIPFVLLIEKPKVCSRSIINGFNKKTVDYTLSNPGEHCLILNIKTYLT